MSDLLYIEKEIEKGLIEGGMNRKEIMDIRAKSNADLLIKVINKVKSTSNNDISFIQYGQNYFLLYTIEDCVEETVKNPLIGGNVVVAIGKKPVTQYEIEHHLEYDNLIRNDFFAPFVFPGELWKKGYVHSIGKTDVRLFEKYCFYHEPSKKFYNSLG